MGPQRQETARTPGLSLHNMPPGESMVGDGVSFPRSMVTVAVSSWERMVPGTGLEPARWRPPAHLFV